MSKTRHTPRQERPCAACKQPIDLTGGAYTLSAGKLQHVTCPARAPLRAAPSLDTSCLSPLSGGEGPGVRSPEFLTLPEAAALLRCHPDTVRTRIADGRLPAFRLRRGLVLLMCRADVLALLEPVPPPLSGGQPLGGRGEKK